MQDRLMPTGSCWCGCGGTTRLGAFFLPGHDRAAEAAVIQTEYGGVPQFLVGHGYGPSGKNPMEELDRHQETKLVGTRDRSIPPRYRPLADYLMQQPNSEVGLSFRDIDEMLGEPLPPSARVHRPWWGNHVQHTQAKAWMNAGWKVNSLDMRNETVTFKRMATAEGERAR